MRGNEMIDVLHGLHHVPDRGTAGIFGPYQDVGAVYCYGRLQRHTNMGPVGAGCADFLFN